MQFDTFEAYHKFSFLLFFYFIYTNGYTTLYQSWKISAYVLDPMLYKKLNWNVIRQKSPKFYYAMTKINPFDVRIFSDPNLYTDLHESFRFFREEKFKF